MNVRAIDTQSIQTVKIQWKLKEGKVCIDRDVWDFMSWPSWWNRDISLWFLSAVILINFSRIFFHLSPNTLRFFSTLFVLCCFNFHIRNFSFSIFFRHGFRYYTHWLSECKTNTKIGSLHLQVFSCCLNAAATAVRKCFWNIISNVDENLVVFWYIFLSSSSIVTC